ncbi:hypothetical protein [Nocardia gipuzkoensis]
MLSTLAASETHDHLIEETARLRRSLLDATASTEERAAVDLDEIHGYCRRADDSPHPMVRLHFLERAVKVATTRGQFAEADCITALMQDIEPSDLGIQVISTSTSLPAWMPESALDPYTQASTWHIGVALFCTDPCAPTGSVAQNREVIAGLDKTLSRLMPTVLLDRGLPRTTLNSDEQQDQHDLARIAQIWADYQGALTAEALRRVGHRYGTPESEELTTMLLDLGALEPRLAPSLAKGFGYFWAGDYEARCGSVSAPTAKFGARLPYPAPASTTPKSSGKPTIPRNQRTAPAATGGSATSDADRAQQPEQIWPGCKSISLTVPTIVTIAPASRADDRHWFAVLRELNH